MYGRAAAAAPRRQRARWRSLKPKNKYTIICMYSYMCGRFKNIILAMIKHLNKFNTILRACAEKLQFIYS